MAMKVDTCIAYDLSVDIGRPPTDVFAAYTHVPALPKWVKSIKAIRNYSGEPLGVGSTYTHVCMFLFKEFKTDVEITAFVPDRLVKYDHQNGPIFGQMAVVFSEIANGTILNVLFDGETNGFFGINAPVLKTNLQKQMRQDLMKFKQVLEK